MKLTIERAVLLTALSHVQSVVERRNTIPILSNVLLEAEGDKLALTATDLSRWGGHDDVAMRCEPVCYEICSWQRIFH